MHKIGILQNLVDLAGSERVSQTNANGVRLIEGSHINRSLLTLTTVIRKLRSGFLYTATFFFLKKKSFVRKKHIWQHGLTKINY